MHSRTIYGGILYIYMVTWYGTLDSECDMHSAVVSMNYVSHVIRNTH
jgi:hypothetical protein